MTSQKSKWFQLIVRRKVCQMDVGQHVATRTNVTKANGSSSLWVLENVQWERKENVTRDEQKDVSIYVILIQQPRSIPASLISPSETQLHKTLEQDSGIIINVTETLRRALLDSLDKSPRCWSSDVFWQRVRNPAESQQNKARLTAVYSVDTEEIKKMSRGRSFMKIKTIQKPTVGTYWGCILSALQPIKMEIHLHFLCLNEVSSSQWRWEDCHIERGEKTHRPSGIP